ncbi:MAG: flotillin family protein, partial [Chlorobia bacterium]|nr:flotillin family protein [Fimbriimonadaceae bacterium]
MTYLIAIGVPVILILVGFSVIKRLIYICAPNEFLIFSGSRRQDGARSYGYKLIKGGRGIRVPLLERVDRMDLTNMGIDIQAVNAYCKGGIPLTVQGVANVKIAGHEPLIHNAIERFLGMTRQEIMQIAKATLEGSLRGILATMTPEQVNEDKLLFAERLVLEVEQDMTSLGLVVDTMKIQNVQDDVKYLDSLGRKRNAEVIAKARVAEATAHADSEIQSAENMERQRRAQLEADTNIAKAEMQRRLTETLTRREALVAEEQAQVIAAVAQSRA